MLSNLIWLIRFCNHRSEGNKNKQYKAKPVFKVLKMCVILFLNTNFILNINPFEWKHNLRQCFISHLKVVVHIMYSTVLWSEHYDTDKFLFAASLLIG